MASGCVSWPNGHLKRLPDCHVLGPNPVAQVSLASLAAMSPEEQGLWLEARLLELGGHANVRRERHPSRKRRLIRPTSSLNVR